MDASAPKTFMRGLRIVDVLCDAGEEGLTIPEIATRAHIQRSTVYRFLSVLLEQNFVICQETSRRFHFNYARLHRHSSVTREISQLEPALRRISAVTGNSTFLIQREGANSLCIHREVGSYPVQVLTVTVGYRQPLGVGAAGLALLSNLPNEDIDQILTANKDTLPRYGGMTIRRMRALIKNTQERGWSVVGNSAVPGVVGVGIPLLKSQGHAILGVSVSSTVDRMSLATQQWTVDVMHCEISKVWDKSLKLDQGNV